MWMQLYLKRNGINKFGATPLENTKIGRVAAVVENIVNDVDDEAY